MLWDRWATLYRNGRALGTLIVLSIFAIWAVWLSSDELMGVEHLTGIVTKVGERRPGSPNGDMVLGEVETEDGKIVSLFLLPPIPQEGDTVPLVVELYASGKNFYSLDVQRWQYGD